MKNQNSLEKKRKNAKPSKEEKKMIKQERNRMSAQKSRQKKKEYVTELEERINFLQSELERTQNAPSKDTMENKLENLKSMEAEYIQYFNSTNFNNTGKTIEERRKLQINYSILQNGSMCEFFKGLLKNMVPLEINYFESNCSMLKDIYNFDSIDTLLKNLKDNQFMLNEAYHFQFSSEQEVSFPLYVYMFYEQLKKFTLSFKEYLVKVRKFNI